MMASSPVSNQAKPAQKTKQASAAEQDRQQRLKKALRKNLIKRKQQTRSREQQKDITEDSSTAKNKGMQD